MGPVFIPILVGHQTSGTYSGKPELLWRYLHLQLRYICSTNKQVCLTSNLTCNSVPSAKEHQAGLYKNSGLPIILCTDDKGVFSCSLSGNLQPSPKPKCFSWIPIFKVSTTWHHRPFHGTRKTFSLWAGDNFWCIHTLYYTRSSTLCTYSTNLMLRKSFKRSETSMMMT